MKTIEELKRELRGCYQRNKRGALRARALGELLAAATSDLTPAIHDGERLSRAARVLKKKYDDTARVTGSVDYADMATTMNPYVVNTDTGSLLPLIKKRLEESRAKDLKTFILAVRDEPWYDGLTYEAVVGALNEAKESKR